MLGTGGSMQLIAGDMTGRSHARSALFHHATEGHTLGRRLGSAGGRLPPPRSLLFPIPTPATSATSTPALHAHPRAPTGGADEE